MKTLYNITTWNDPELVARHFKARMDWFPYGAGPSYAVNWAEGLMNDQCKYKTEGIELFPYPFFNDHFACGCWSLDQPESIYGLSMAFGMNMLVGNQAVSRGRFTFGLQLSCSLQVTEAAWFLSKTHKIFKKEYITPELDALESNTPQHLNEMSHAVITRYDPFRALYVRKEPLAPFSKPFELVVTLKAATIVCDTPVSTYTVPRCRYLLAPIYPLLWCQAPAHLAGPIGLVMMKVFHAKLEV